VALAGHPPGIQVFSCVRKISRKVCHKSLLYDVKEENDEHGKRNNNLFQSPHRL